MTDQRTEDMEWGFDFDPESCIQCHACEVACRTWRKADPGINRRRVFWVTSGKYPFTKMQTFSLSCLHCVHPDCVEACPKGALSKGENGVVSLDNLKCIGCGKCARVCPYHVPQIKKRHMIKCDMCLEQVPPGSGRPPCVCVCPTGALSLRLMTPSEKEAVGERMKQALENKKNEYRG